MKNDDKAVQGAKTPYSAKSAGNAIGFIAQREIGEINTALPVQVQAVYPGDTAGYVDVLPLVGTTDGKKNFISPVTLYHLPYSRIQGGAAALIIDPVVGDKGLAVFCSSDVSTVTAETTEPQQPGSYRGFSMSDGYYIGGFLNQKPAVYVEVDPGGVININTNGGTCNIQTGTANITAPGGVNVTGNISVTGTMTVSGDVNGGGISLTGHTHGGVETGGGSTGGPQ